MGFIWAIIIGLVVGALAKLIMPGRQGGGIIVTILLGIAGSLVATWLGQAMHLYRPGQEAGFIGSIVGAVIILAVYRWIAQRRAVPSDSQAFMLSGILPPLSASF